MKDAILGIDVGTSSTKAILFDLSGNEVTSAGQSYPLLTPQAGWVKQDSEEVWQALIHVLQDIVKQSSGYRILSLAIAAQAGSIIPVDLEGNPVYPMITWLDTRSQELSRSGRQMARRQRSASERMAAVCRAAPPRWWLRQQLPDVHSKAKRLSGARGFLNYRLPGGLQRTFRRLRKCSSKISKQVSGAKAVRNWLR